MTEWLVYHKTAPVEARRIDGPDDVPAAPPDGHVERSFVHEVDSTQALVETREGNVLADFPFYLVRAAGSIGPVWPCAADDFQEWYEAGDGDPTGDIDTPPECPGCGNEMVFSYMACFRDSSKRALYFCPQKVEVCTVETMSIWHTFTRSD